MEGIIEKNRFDEIEFKERFLDKKVVVYKGHVNHWAAIKSWTPDYFAKACPDIPITTKVFGEDEIISKNQSMAEYVELLREYRALRESDPEVIVPYCHDIPIFLLAEELKNDIDSFPSGIMPPWYGEKWWKFAQFFMSSKGSVTPLHFDTLLSNNVFFQIQGSKLFTIYYQEDGKYCYRKKWRWFDVNPEEVDLERYPKYQHAKKYTVLVEPGDMFYMPPGTLHHVRSLEDCISFNVDFHTKRSSVESFKGMFKGMPREIVHFNILCLLSVYIGDSKSILFNRYKRYLNYIS